MASKKMGGRKACSHFYVYLGCQGCWILGKMPGRLCREIQAMPANALPGICACQQRRLPFLAFCDWTPSPIDHREEYLFFPPTHPGEGAKGGQYTCPPVPSVLFSFFPGQQSINPIFPCSCRYLAIVQWKLLFQWYGVAAESNGRRRDSKRSYECMYVYCLRLNFRQA
jgi:hypothetical protein